MELGSSLTVAATVTESKTAAAVGSGDAAVFATPMMVAMMENAAMKLAATFLEEGQTTVGTRVEVSHTAATPVGMTVRATATLTAAEGRRLTFSMEAFDERGPIGEGVQQRTVVDRERFVRKTYAKGREPSGEDVRGGGQTGESAEHKP